MPIDRRTRSAGQSVPSPSTLARCSARLSTDPSEVARLNTRRLAVNVFAAANYDSLSQEMAQGGGEHLASLAELMGIRDENRAEFYALAQVQYASLVQSGDRTPAAMLKVLHRGMETHPTFARLSSN